MGQSIPTVRDLVDLSNSHDQKRTLPSADNLNSLPSFKKSNSTLEESDSRGPSVTAPTTATASATPSASSSPSLARTTKSKNSDERTRSPPNTDNTYERE